MEETGMRPRLVLVIVLALGAGCGALNPDRPILSPRPKGEIREPDGAHYSGAAFANDGKEVLLAGSVLWDSKRARYAREPHDAAYW
jgi:hypothetical protein